MSYWTWDSELNLGIKEVDEQHQRIVEYINELHAARINNSRSQVESVLLGLVDYTRTHFAYEEELMQHCQYPNYELHQRAHNAFVEHIDRYVKQFAQGRDITSVLMVDLKVWLMNHIRNEDRDYEPYAKKFLHPNWIRVALNKFFAKYL